jgi:26S proteasome regulatory subunit T4
MAIPSIPYERRLLIMADPRDKALQDYRKKLLEHKEIDGRLKERECAFISASSCAWTYFCL